MKIKKIDREFLLSDSSVNVYGFRLLTSGYQADEYKKNPIGYHMHERKNGIVVKWDDLAVKGDKIVGKPVINMSNARGQQTVDEIEEGFLNAASMGHFVVLEHSDDPALKLPGQTGPTITKWYNRECSLCDIPGNYNALALFDSEGNEIKLADLSINKKPNMKQIILTADQLTKMNLKADSDASAVDQIINDLVAKAGKVDELTNQLSAANTAKKKADDDLAALQESTKKDKVKTIGEKALADKKITAELKDKLDKKFENDPESYQDLVDSMKPYESVVQQLNTGEVASDDPQVKALMAKSGEELWKSGELDKLKKLNLTAYKTKYKEYFGEDAPKDDA